MAGQLGDVRTGALRRAKPAGSRVCPLPALGAAYLPDGGLVLAAISGWGRLPAPLCAEGGRGRGMLCPHP